MVRTAKKSLFTHKQPSPWTVEEEKRLVEFVVLYGHLEEGKPDDPKLENPEGSIKWPPLLSENNPLWDKAAIYVKDGSNSDHIRKGS